MVYTIIDSGTDLNHGIAYFVQIKYSHLYFCIVLILDSNCFESFLAVLRRCWLALAEVHAAVVQMMVAHIELAHTAADYNLVVHIVVECKASVQTAILHNSCLHSFIKY